MKNMLLLLLALLGLTTRPAAGQAPGALSGQVLSVSDIHFGAANPALYDTLLVLPVTQWEAWLKTQPSENAPIVISPAQNNWQDTNYWLLSSALDAMQARCPRPDFIVITGDLLAHNLTGAPATPSQLALMRSIYQFLELQLLRRFPASVVLPGLGNNDTDMGDDNPPSPRFREMFAQVWAPRVYPGNEVEQQQFIADFTPRGYYSYALPGAPGRRLLMLNSVLFLNHGTFAPARAQAASQELGWLQQQLGTAQPTDRLWLGMHVPHGINTYRSAQQCAGCLQGAPAGAPGCSTPMWEPGPARTYRATIAAHRNLIKAGLAGHTHMDEFRLLTDSLGAALSFLHVTPSVSPYFQNNSGFQVLDYEPTSLALRNVHTYYLNLNPSPKLSAWTEEYAFAQTYHATGLDLPNLQQVWNSLGAFGTAQQKSYATFFTASALPPAGNPSPTSAADWPYYWCTIGQTTGPDYCQCLAQWQKKYGPSAKGRKGKTARR